MIRLAVCIDDSPTMLYTERFLTKGKTYHVMVESRGQGGLVKVLDPDPVVVHEVKTTMRKIKFRDQTGQLVVTEEPEFTLTGDVARTEARGAIRCTADRFQILPGSDRTMEEIWADAPEAKA